MNEYNRGMAEPAICDICGMLATPHGHYVVKMEVYADPSLPAVTTEELDQRDPGDEIKKLIEQMKGMTADELQDQVHRRFEFKICPACQPRFLANPLGLPRVAKTGAN